MLGIGPTELIVVLVIALLIFGPKRLPDVGRSLGRGMREFKESVTGADREEFANTDAPDAPRPPGACNLHCPRASMRSVMFRRLVAEIFRARRWGAKPWLGRARLTRAVQPASGYVRWHRKSRNLRVVRQRDGYGTSDARLCGR